MRCHKIDSNGKTLDKNSIIDHNNDSVMKDAQKRNTVTEDSIPGLSSGKCRRSMPIQRCSEEVYRKIA